MNNKETLKKARYEYSKKPSESFPFTNYKELEKVFHECASEKEKEIFWSTPVFDRPNFIRGNPQSKMDAEFNKAIKTIFPTSRKRY